MSFFKKMFGGKKEEPIRTYEDFWKWFSQNSDHFYQVVKSNHEITERFLDKIRPRLGDIKDGFFFLTGMIDENTADLVLTADGNLKNIAFVEELVAVAPAMDNWKITCLKQPFPREGLGIRMGGFEFSESNLYFYANENKDYPDEIDITIVHDDYDEENKDAIINGSYIFLDNFLGEITFAETIDNLEYVAKEEAKKELVPIKKLKEFLNWRQKEFLEKYEGTRYNTENDNYSMLEGQVEDGKPLLAVINTEILNWDSKASHPWVAVLDLQYEGHENGLPEEEDFKFLDKIEEEIMEELKDFEGYLNIGRETADNSRVIYFACKDFRKPSKVFYEIEQKYHDKYEVNFDIFKDKYWRSFNRFIVH